MWELNHKESWAPKNWCFWAVVLEKTLESPLDFKELKPVNTKGGQSWRFIVRMDAEAETPMLSLVTWCEESTLWKRPWSGKDWKWEEKGMTEDEMVGWYIQLNGHESEQALGVGDGQGGLACCSPWSRKELDTTEQLNWTEWMLLNRWKVTILYNDHFEKGVLHRVMIENEWTYGCRGRGKDRGKGFLGSWRWPCTHCCI